MVYNNSNAPKLPVAPITSVGAVVPANSAKMQYHTAVSSVAASALASSYKQNDNLGQKTATTTQSPASSAASSVTHSLFKKDSNSTQGSIPGGPTIDDENEMDKKYAQANFNSYASLSSEIDKKSFSANLSLKTSSVSTATTAAAVSATAAASAPIISDPVRYSYPDFAMLPGYEPLRKFMQFLLQSYIGKEVKNALHPPESALAYPAIEITSADKFTLVNLLPNSASFKVEKKPGYYEITGTKKGIHQIYTKAFGFHDDAEFAIIFKQSNKPIRIGNGEGRSVGNAWLLGVYTRYNDPNIYLFSIMPGNDDLSGFQISKTENFPPRPK